MSPLALLHWSKMKLSSLLLVRSLPFVLGTHLGQSLSSDDDLSTKNFPICQCNHIKIASEIERTYELSIIRIILRICFFVYFMNSFAHCQEIRRYASKNSDTLNSQKIDHNQRLLRSYTRLLQASKPVDRKNLLTLFEGKESMVDHCHHQAYLSLRKLCISSADETIPRIA